MKKTILFIIASTLLFTTSCKNNKPSKPKTTQELLNKISTAPGLNAGEDNYVISIPKGWKMVDTVFNNIKFHFIYAPPQDAENGVIVSMLNESSLGKSFDEYMDATEKNMEADMPQYKQYEKGTFMSYDIKGEWLHYSAKMNSVDMECMSYLIPKDGIVYIMTGRTSKGKMNKYRSTFDRMAQSFKFKD